MAGMKPMAMVTLRTGVIAMERAREGFAYVGEKLGDTFAEVQDELRGRVAARRAPKRKVMQVRRARGRTVRPRGRRVPAGVTSLESRRRAA
jgi:hypothetical protein